MGLTTDPNDPALNQIRSDGQQEAYLVLSEEERAKGGYADIPLTEASLNTIRETANNLIAQWEALEADSFFDLDFEG